MTSAAPASPAARLSLAGKAAVVSGAGGGIGSAIARDLLLCGARVASVDLDGHPGPEGVVDLPCDLGDPDAIEALGPALDRSLGGVDVLVHSAGLTRDAVLWKMDRAAWEQVLRVNLDSAFHLLRLAVPRMRARGDGRVVLVSSINGERGKLGQSNYAASKAGLIGLARSLAREVGRFGIRVNVVAPGLIETPMTAGLPDPVKEAAVRETALGRIGAPEDVAGSVLFLVSDLSRHVTGQVLRVDGGQLMA